MFLKEKNKYDAEKINMFIHRLTLDIKLNCFSNCMTEIAVAGAARQVF
jgi:hypothetical protein